MFFFYSLNLEDFSVKLYDFCRTKDGVTDMLDTIARSFIRREEGERRAEEPYRDDTADDAITEDGYFLRHSATAPDQIDVYIRKSQVLEGRVWNSYEITCKQTMLFSVTEASLNLPIECTGKGVIKPTFGSALEAQQESDHLEKLKARLVEQRKKIELQLAEEDLFKDLPELVDDDNISESESESSIVYEVCNPYYTLKKRMEDEVESAQAVDAYYIPPAPPLPVGGDYCYSCGELADLESDDGREYGCSSCDLVWWSFPEESKPLSSSESCEESDSESDTVDLCEDSDELLTDSDDSYDSSD